MKDRRSLLALVIMVVGLTLVVYALLTPVGTGSGVGGSGHHTTSGRTLYDALNIVLVILGTSMAAAGGTLFGMAYFTHPYHGRGGGREAPTVPPRTLEAEGTERPVAFDSPDDHRLVLRLLTGDEREVFRSLADAGGEQLQRDVVAGTGMSDAKVSRVLDRLEGKGLVERERRGMGNVVRIALDRTD